MTEEPVYDMDCPLTNVLYFNFEAEAVSRWRFKVRANNYEEAREAAEKHIQRLVGRPYASEIRQVRLLGE